MEESAKISLALSGFKNKDSTTPRCHLAGPHSLGPPLLKTQPLFSQKPKMSSLGPRIASPWPTPLWGSHLHGSPLGGGG